MGYFRHSVVVNMVALGVWAGAAHAQEAGTRADAQAMVEAAIQHVKKAGPARAFKDFSDKSNARWHHKDLYVFAYNMAGVNVAHGANEKLVGKDFSEFKDPTGRPLIKLLRETAMNGGGWVAFQWPHPQTKIIEDKVSYTRKMLNYDGFLGVGVYR